MKVWLITPSFCKANLLAKFLEHIYKTPPKTEFTHIIIDNHYPIDKETNRKKILTLAMGYKCKYIDSGKDLGLHRGLNNAIIKAGIEPGDILVGCDPDDLPSPGFLDIFYEVMKEDPRLAVSCASFGVIEQRVKEGVPFAKREIAGHPILIHPTIEMWNVAAFNMQFIFDMGGFHQSHAYYGGIEVALQQAWNRRGMYYGYLPEINSEYAMVDRTDKTLFDPEYREWKTAHIGGFKGSFEEWLNQMKTKVC